MKFVEIVKPDINLDFVGKRRIAYVASALVILVALASLIIRGPNYGIDFVGGTIVQVRVDGTIEARQVREAAVELGLDDARVQGLGKAGQEFLIRTSSSHVEGEELRGRLTSSLAKLVGEGKVEVRRVEMVGPKVSHDLRQKALFAVLYSLLFMAIYISGRFELKWVPPAVMAVALVAFSYFLYTWAGLELGYVIVASFALIVALSVALSLRYALGAIVALFHDVIVVTGVFSLFGLEVSLSMVAALLTIIGYSVNDSIIVFDRIRENRRRYSRSSLESIVNRSINQTLSRTILTSGTVIIVLAAFLALGGGVIREFALAMLIGVVTGTYSSIYVASPILLAWPEKRPAAPRKARAVAPVAPKEKRAEATKGRKRKKSRQRKAEAAGGS